MTKLLANAALKHTLLAAGAAIAAAAALMPAHGPIDWRAEAITALVTFLSGMGIGYAARQQPASK